MHRCAAARGTGVGGTIQIAGATPISPLLLSRGCNSVIVTSAAGTQVAAIAALVSPASAAVSIWRFDNGAKLFRAGWFADRSAPVDFATTGNGDLTPGRAISSTGRALPTGEGVTNGGGPVTETYYVCVSQGATLA